MMGMGRSIKTTSGWSSWVRRIALVHPRPRHHLDIGVAAKEHLKALADNAMIVDDQNFR